MLEPNSLVYYTNLYVRILNRVLRSLRKSQNFSKHSVYELNTPVTVVHYRFYIAYGYTYIVSTANFIRTLILSKQRGGTDLINIFALLNSNLFDE